MRSLNTFFWGGILVIILIGISQILLIPEEVIDAQLSRNLQSAAILSLLAGIPLALWLYNKKLTSKTLPDDIEQRIVLIRYWFNIRLFLIQIVFLFNVVVYAITKENSFLFCCGMAFLILLFLCRPNRDEIVNILSKNNL